MLNIIELERKWLRYKIKSYIPLVTIGISLTIITSISYILLTDNTTQHTKNKELLTNKTPQITSKQEENTSEETAKVIISKIQNKDIQSLKKKTQEITHQEIQKVKLSPSLDFMKKMQNSIQPYYENELENSIQKTKIVSHTNAIKEKTIEKPLVVKKEKPIQQQVEIEKKITTRINIQRKNTQNDIFEIIKRFKKNNNPALSLFIAKKYYELGDYRQSYNYSLITNEINKGIESSWIIFTKSLVKLNKKDKAIATLEKYIKHSHSSSAKILYDEIKSGKFK